MKSFSSLYDIVIPLGPRKVFIVYSNEDTTVEEIEDLCDILNKLSTNSQARVEFVCDCDLKHRQEFGIEWSNWTEQQIRQADIVLLVCSHRLHACLSQWWNPPAIKTATGLVSAAAITNHCSILRQSSRKFIPVFLNRSIDRDLVPTSLVGRKAFCVNTTGLMAIETDGMSEEEFSQAIREYLRDHQADDTKDLVELLECLKRVS